MATSKSQIRSNLIYGAIALLPLCIVAYVIFKVAGPVKTATAAISPYLGTDPYLATLIILVMTVFVLAFLCYLLGALVSSEAGGRAFETVQSKFGNVVPGYEIVTNLLRGVAGEEKAYPPAMIRLFGPGTAVLGFVMEDVDDSHVTVFIPSTPVLTVGAVHIVERSRVRMIDGNAKAAAECIGQWGLGMQELLRGGDCKADGI